MKKVLFAVAFTAGAFVSVQAQAYKTSLGVNIDLGEGPTYVGPQVKHFFNQNSAGSASVLFGGNNTALGFDYTYNQGIPGARGLNWFVGVGPHILFYKGGSSFALRPQVGLEFKIPAAPLAMSFDWKPWWQLSQNSNFEPARFSFGFKYTFK